MIRKYTEELYSEEENEEEAEFTEESEIAEGSDPMAEQSEPTSDEESAEESYEEDDEVPWYDDVEEDDTVLAATVIPEEPELSSNPVTDEVIEKASIEEDITEEVLDDDSDTEAFEQERSFKYLDIDILNEQTEEDFDEDIESELLEEADDVVIDTDAQTEEAREDSEAYIDLDKELEYSELPVKTYNEVEIDDDITFDQLEDGPDDEGIVFESIALDADAQEDEEVEEPETFEEVEESETFEEVEEPETFEEVEESETFEEVEEPIISEKLEENELEEYVAEDESALDEAVEEFTSDEEEKVVTRDFGEPEDFVADAFEDSVAEEETLSDDISDILDEQCEKTYDIGSAELSLLMQLGCDEEIFSLASDEAIENISISDSIDSIPSVSLEGEQPDEYGEFYGEKRIPETPAETREALEEKILSVYEAQQRRRGGILIRLILTSTLAFFILLYEILPFFGIYLPGILDKREFFFSYVLIGLQLLVLCCLPSYKYLWHGLKKLFTKRPNGYSIAVVLTAATALYDIVIMSVKVASPHTFHFAVALVLVIITVSECIEISMKMKTYRYFFTDRLARARGDVIIDGSSGEKQFTLRRSRGRNSIAERMYNGGLDPTKRVYEPIEVDSAAGYFSAAELRGDKTGFSMAAILPMVAVSLIVGILAFVFVGTEEFWVCLAAFMVSLLLSMPVCAIFAVWLPFELFNLKNEEQGFSFVNESNAQKYSKCDIFAFKDMHVFNRCLPQSVNIATYDATPRDVLLACLDGVYSKIGGPMQNVFAVGDNRETPLGECHINRIARRGVEATVGANYTVLIGNEKFMNRYGLVFPKVDFKNPEDERFSLCVSINGRVSARIMAKYTLNEAFEMFAKRLSEDGMYATVQTFDPLINADLISDMRGKGRLPVSVVHMGKANINDVSRTRKEGILFDIDGESMGVVAKNSRLNLVVAASNSKKMKKMRKRVNLYCFLASIFGALVAFSFVFFGWIEGISQFFVMLYWIAAIGGLITVIAMGLPDKERFSLDQFRYEESLSEKKKRKKQTEKR